VCQPNEPDQFGVQNSATRMLKQKLCLLVCVCDDSEDSEFPIDPRDVCCPVVSTKGGFNFLVQFQPILGSLHCCRALVSGLAYYQNFQSRNHHPHHGMARAAVLASCFRDPFRAFIGIASRRFLATCPQISTPVICSSAHLSFSASFDPQFSSD
jgi:hypothetical protein